MSLKVPIWQLIWRMVRYTFRLYLFDSLLWLFITGLPALPGLVLRAFFDSLTGDRAESASLQSPFVFVALLLAIGVARIVVIFMGRVTKTQHRFTMSSLLQRNLLEQLLARPGAKPFTTQKQKAISPGEIISFFRDDAAQIEDNVVGTNEILSAGIFAALALTILLTINARLTILVFLPLVLITFSVRQAEQRIKRYRRASRHATQQVTGLLGELFTAVQAIQLAGAESDVLHHLQHLNQQRLQYMVRDRVFTAIIGSILENCVNLGTGMILLLAAQSMSAATNPLTVGDFALFVYYLGFTSDFLWFLGGFLALTKQTEVSFERMEELLNQSEPDENQNAEGLTYALVAPQPMYLHSIWGRKPPLPSIKHPHHVDCLEELKAVDLTYCYPESQNGIFNVSLELERGSLTVITGRVGSGKTTLLRVLLGLLPAQSGKIYWNGQWVKDPTNFFMPFRSAYTPQVPQLFSHTLRENLLLGLNPNEAELRQAIDLAVFESDLAGMPNGLETLLGTKGVRLSGGQLQRAAAARMLIRQPELLVFDDLSSALDVETELKLWSRLFTINAQDGNGNSSAYPSSLSSKIWTPTFLVVSHRRSVLQSADRVIVLRNGRIKAEGQLEQLLKSCDEMSHLQ